jgi:hypothetical protein
MHQIIVIDLNSLSVSEKSNKVIRIKLNHKAQLFRRDNMINFIYR